ncbi:MAG TPA: SDR family NAD(P)-dependent oxidoreductase [Longimicrobiales bacterium]|nr:SDR family NAD(P)-dependent oxidoreductase [Longimicrobiales bacterium]
MRLAGKTALITGAGSGIGRETALRFAAEGARVAATDVNAARADAVAGELAGAQCLSRALDVRVETDWEAAIAEVMARWGRLDILVANAGVSFARPVAEMTLEEWRHVHAVNLDGVFLGTKHAVRAMKAGGGGSIVIVASASGIRASAGASAYSSSKGAVRLFAKAVARECAPDGIRVNVVAPGGVITPMWREMPFFAALVAEHGEAGAWAALAEQTPLGRFARADEIAAAILYLASDEAACVTGTDVVIDGGYTA